VTQIAAGAAHGLALKSNGRIVAWGRDNRGQTDVPTGLSGVVALAAGGDVSVALHAVRPDALIKRSGQARYVGNDVYSPKVQSITWSATRGQTRSFHLRFQNDGQNDTYTVQGCAGRKAFRVTYIGTRTGTDVTAQVTAGTYHAAIRQRRHRDLIMKITPTRSATIGTVVRCVVTATSAIDHNLHDTVRADVTVTRTT
jgi:hypothetical protein